MLLFLLSRASRWLSLYTEGAMEELCNWRATTKGATTEGAKVELCNWRATTEGATIDGANTEGAMVEVCNWRATSRWARPLVAMIIFLVTLPILLVLLVITSASSLIPSLITETLK